MQSQVTPHAELARETIDKKQLADILGINFKTVNNKLNGKSEFTLSEIMTISNLFSTVSIEYIFEQPMVNELVISSSN